MTPEEQAKKWAALMKQLETVHRFLYMYLRWVKFRGVEGDGVLVTVDDDEKYAQLEEGLTQYAASLTRYLSNHFGAGCHLVVSREAGPAEEGAAAAPGPPSTGSSQDFEVLLRRGQELAADPEKREEALVLLGQAAEGFGRAALREPRLAALRQMLALKPDSLETRQLFAETLASAGPLQEAGHEFRALAQYFYENNRLEEALAAARQAAENLDPEGYLILARAHLQFRRLPEAEAALAAFLKDHPRHFEALRLLLEISGQKQDPEEVMRAALRLCQADPADPTGFEALARYFEFQNQASKSQGLSLQAAEAYLNRHQFEQAAGLIRKVLAAAPDNAVAQRLARRLDETSALPPSARVDPVGAPPGPGPAGASGSFSVSSAAYTADELKAMAAREFYEGVKHLDNAIAAYRQLLKSDPKNGEARARLNELYPLMGKVGEIKP